MKAIGAWLGNALALIVTMQSDACTITCGHNHSASTCLAVGRCPDAFPPSDHCSASSAIWLLMSHLDCTGQG